MIYDIEANTETPLPDLPNGVRVTNPFDGSATLLPLSPPDFAPEVLVCGGTNTSDQLDFTKFSSQTPATDQCSRIKLTPEGIEKGWEVELMPEGHIMPEILLLPNGQAMIMNGGQSGYSAYGNVVDPVSNSNADHPKYVSSFQIRMTSNHKHSASHLCCTTQTPLSECGSLERDYPRQI